MTKISESGRPNLKRRDSFGLVRDTVVWVGRFIFMIAAREIRKLFSWLCSGDNFFDDSFAHVVLLSLSALDPLEKNMNVFCPPHNIFFRVESDEHL